MEVPKHVLFYLPVLLLIGGEFDLILSATSGFKVYFLGNTFFGQVTDNFTNMETYRKVMDVKNRSTDIFGIS